MTQQRCPCGALRWHSIGYAECGLLLREVVGRTSLLMKKLALFGRTSYHKSMKQGGRGFTVVELAVVIIVMAMLLVLGVVAFRGMQAAARDKERQADIQALANYLESLYPREIRQGTVVIKPAGEYPSRQALSQPSQRWRVFAELESGVWKSPGASTNDAVQLAPTSGTIMPHHTTYLYEPISGTGGPCETTGSTPDKQCRSFRLHYTLESGKTEIVESKHT